MKERNEDKENMNFQNSSSKANQPLPPSGEFLESSAKSKISGVNKLKGGLA